MKIRNRILAAFIVFALSLSVIQLPVISAYAAEDTVAPAQWAADDIQMLERYNLTEEGLFEDYQEQITREELCVGGVDLYEGLTGKELSPASPNPFRDTDTPEILKAYAAKFINRYSQKRFEPDRLANRRDVVLFFYSVMKASEPALDTASAISLKFRDTGTLRGISLDAVKCLVGKGILKGTPDNRLDLGAYCSRQEFLVLTKRVYEAVLQDTGKASKGLMWKISGGKNQVYVLGSVHIADIGVYPLSRGIEEAFRDSDSLAVEANIVQDMEGIAYMQEKSVYADENTLEKNVSPETYKLLKDKMEKMGISKYEKLKPWYAAMLLQNLSLVGSSYDASLGIDVHFLSKAAENKNIIEIEGIKFQVDLFDGFSPKLQEQFLLSTLKEDAGDSSKETIDDIVSAWKAGDASEIEKLLKAMEADESEASREFNDKLLHERNKNMTEKVTSYLEDESGKTTMVVVGAAHLLGDTGIIKSLKDKGYTVEQVLQ